MAANDKVQDIIPNIIEIYQDTLLKRYDFNFARNHIHSLLRLKETMLCPHFPSIVSLFPDNQVYIHINQVYQCTPTSPYLGLCFTLTPSPSHKHPILLVHPNVVINDTSSRLFDLSYNQYTIRPIFFNKASSQQETHEHIITWICQDHPYYLKVKTGDKIIFHSQDERNTTVTSADYKYQIPINPDYDLTLLPGKRGEVILTQPGDYFFVSRPHKKSRRLHVEVI